MPTPPLLPETRPLDRLLEPQTDRLLLRRWRDEDRAPFADLNADPEVMEFFPALLSREDSDAMVDRMTAQLDAEGWGLWAVEVRETGEFIGFVGLARPRFEARFTPCIEVGWRLKRSAWGHGYASEAATEALRIAFDELGLREVVSFTASVNVRSRAVMQRIGMTHDLTDDFDHPLLDEGDVLHHHVLYRVHRGDDLSGGPDRGAPTLAAEDPMSEDKQEELADTFGER